MGSQGTRDMIEYGGRDIALEWHLFSNHYPPLPPAALDIAKQALELAPDWDAPVDGVTHENGTPVTVSEVIEAYHLDSFLDEETY